MKPRLGIALGGGAARGWAHVGVLQALKENGIEPDVVCGTSIGALVGGIYVSGRIDDFAEWVCGLSRIEMLSLVDFTVIGGGAIRGDKLVDLFRRHVSATTIEELPRPFAAVATDLHTGAEVWLQRGQLLTAIRASLSLPGIFTPVRVDGRWLADGGLVNPVPVNLCRAMGAEVVIAVDLNNNRMGNQRYRVPSEVNQTAVARAGWREKLGSYLPTGFLNSDAEKTNGPPAPGFGEVMGASLAIMQDRISRSRLAGDPPDLLISPRLGHIEPLDFSGGRPTIEEGHASVRRMLPALNHLLNPGLPAE
jgi:NTE family protein